MGTDNEFIFRNDDAGNADATTVWELSEDLGGFISSVAFDPQDENIAYATSSTFGQNHIFRSTDAGATWTAIDNLGEPNGIPDIPVHSIVVDPEDSRRLFVGTDLGVFVSIDTGANWMVENGGFANTPTETLEFEGRTLFAFTHGRSAYRVRLNDLLRTSDSTATTAEDTALEVQPASFVDNIDGAGVFVPQFIEIVSVSNGSLANGDDAVNAGDIIAIDDLDGLMFTPSQDFNGTADISWQARNDVQVVTRELATIAVEVTPVNDAPIGQPILDVTAANDGTFVLNVSGNFSDVDGDTLTFSATGLPEGLGISSDGTIAGDPPGGTTSNVTVTDGEETASSSFTLPKPSSGGSLNIQLLLALAILIGLRRRKF
ncbi:GlyGly-CTERM sorting domain-containing protein [Alteromonadaceae bacterium M269]|nr:GlyGly-CTERM sorting domain-containing protein [Alteromonadaceae bacterium M269]